MSTKMSVTRRRLLKVAAIASVGSGVASFFLKAKKPLRELKTDDRAQLAHRLLKKDFPNPVRRLRQKVVIIGGGISGLSTGWWLKRNGFHDFSLLELAGQIGGNSISGENSVSKFPWGAHYVPIPTENAIYVREFFEEIGVITGYSSLKRPIFNEDYICHDPEERIYFQGKWREGVVPNHGLNQMETAQFKEFFELMEEFRIVRGIDGKRAFEIPLEQSSMDTKYLKFDSLTMKEFMLAHGWNARPLLWYVNYCCRDDYGSTIEQVSAWAGIHYFASRNGFAENAEPNQVLTWPEGNGFLVKKYLDKIEKNVYSNALVFNLEKRDGKYHVKYFDTLKNESLEIVADEVVFAAPLHTFKYVAGSLIQVGKEIGEEIHKTPWVIANLTVARDFAQQKGAPLSWDNVSYYSDSLGYISATHQDFKLNANEYVLTYYLPLSTSQPKIERQRAQSLGLDYWRDLILNDLSAMHPKFREYVKDLEIKIWGHGMVTPTPGYIWNKKRIANYHKMRGLHFAHTDVSGISIFEQAQYLGVMAAKQILNRMSQELILE